MSLDVGKAISDILLSNEAITSKVGDRIFPILSQNDTQYPFIVYRRSGLAPAYTKDYSVEDTVFVDVVTVAEKYRESLEIAKAVRKALENKRGVFAGLNITGIRLNDSAEDGEDVFTQGLTFEITINIEQS